MMQHQQQQINATVRRLAYLSGQKKDTPISEIEHSYAKVWYRRPNNLRVRPTRYLFLKNFPRHFLSSNPFGVDTTGPEGVLDVGSMEDLKRVPIAQSQTMIDELIRQNLEQQQQNNDQQPTREDHDLNATTDTTTTTTTTPDDDDIDTSCWTQQMERLYFKTCRVLQNDYLTRLVHESSPSEAIDRLNLMEYTSIQIRHLFANIAGWDAELLVWLHSLLVTQKANHSYLIPIYHQVMQYLRQRLPALIDRFYPPTVKLEPNQVSLVSPAPASADDPVAKAMIKNKAIPKRLPGGPIFMIVPCGSNMPPSSSRKDFWRLMFGSMGQLVTVSLAYKPELTSIEILALTKAAVRDKIRETRRKKSNETRPIVLVGFQHSSVLAIHCALENPGQINAIICLGFPLASMAGVRGDLDEPMLDITVPILFVVGSMSSTTNIEDLERLRELITRSDTGLVVIGGANDKLVVRYEKKLSDGITQVMVDRCVGDEIYDFINSVLNPRSEPAKLRLDLS